MESLLVSFSKSIAEHIFICKIRKIAKTFDEILCAAMCEWEGLSKSAEFDLCVKCDGIYRTRFAKAEKNCNAGEKCRSSYWNLAWCPPKQKLNEIRGI